MAHLLNINIPMVREVPTLEEFNQVLQETQSLVVVDFTAAWCGPCQHIAPKFAKLPEQYPNVVFLKVDVDKNRATASQEKIRAMPTFKFYKLGGKLFHVFRGASMGQLESSIQTYMNDDAEPNQSSVESDGESVYCSIL